MLKVISGSLLFLSLFSSSSFAENCIISNAHKSRECSSEYFKANNERELNDYLLNGKFKEGKLLNLNIGFNIKEKEINIATSCDLKISKARGLFAKQNGICLKGASIQFEGENELKSDRNAPIAISAKDSVLVRRSLLETKGEITISTSNFLPFDGEILISRDSNFKAKRIHINSKSSLIINSGSKLKSENIVLDGGNCEINEGNDSVNNDERVHDRECKRFKPQFKYSGTCASNSLTTNLKIISSTSSNKPQSVNFSLSGAPTGSTIEWKFDHAYQSFESVTKQDFIYPGKHLAQVVLIGQNGYFRKIGQYINVSPEKINKGQMAIFQFIDKGKNKDKVIAFIDLKPVELSLIGGSSDLYCGEIASNLAGVKNISIPSVDYYGKFYLNILPKIKNPEKYLSDSLISIETMLNNLNGNSNGSNINYDFLFTLTQDLKKIINALSSNEKIELANYIQANSIVNISVVNSSNEKKLQFSESILNLFISSATANEVSTMEKKVTHHSRGVVANTFIILGGLGGVKLGLDMLKDKNKIKQACGIVSILGGIAFVATGFGFIDAISGDIFSLEGIAGKVLGDAQSGEVVTLRLYGNFIPLNRSTAKSQLLMDVVNSKEEINKKILDYNNSIASINSLFSRMNMQTIVPKINFLNLPINSNSGTVSSDFVDQIKIIQSETDDVSISSIEKNDENIQMIITGSRSQNIVVRIHYKNDDLGIDQYLDINGKLIVAPKAVINYTKNNLVVNFDSTDPQGPEITGLTYIWEFGDGQTITTGSKTFSHSYSVSGNYNVTLIVADSNGNQDIATTTIQVQGESEVVCENSTITFGVIQEDNTGNDGVVFDCGGSCDNAKVTVQFPVIPFRGSSMIFYDLSRTKFLLVDRYFSWRGHTGMTYPVSVCHTRDSQVSWYSTNAGSTVCGWGVVPCN